ncbi:hypothetical protein [Pseudorhodoferax sp.]|uniref:hypothetical protein n=1 Tax=Pseudorhodoferax sp. TaxID=1993553 RepID=UPI002DD67FE4|nr:hypothetical protein [Pseudorhodoferax sp.]
MQAYFGFPVGTALGPDGAIYVRDSAYGAIRKVMPDGSVSTVVRNLHGYSSFAFAHDQSIYSTRYNVLQRIAPDGSVTDHPYPYNSLFLFQTMDTLAPAPGGGVYIGAGTAILHFSPSTGFNVIAGRLDASGSSDGSRFEARFSDVRDLVVDGAGNIYVAEPWTATVRKIAVDGTVSTFGASGQQGQIDGPAHAARFSMPSSLALHPLGSVWVLEQGIGTIRRIDRDGMVSSPYSWSARLMTETAAYAIGSNASGDLLALHARGILKLQPDGTSVSLAGQTPETQKSSLSSKTTELVGVDASGNSIVRVQTDAGPVLRKIDPMGAPALFGTQASVALSFQDIAPETTNRWAPTGIQMDSSGNLVVAAQLIALPAANSSGRYYGGGLFLVTPDGQLKRLGRWPPTTTSRTPTTIAADEQAVYFVDGSSGDVVRWDRTHGTQEMVLPALSPVAMALHQGNLYLLTPQGTVLKLSGGTVETVVPADMFQKPTSLVAAEDGSLYVADQEVVWKIPHGGTPQVLAGTRGQFGVRLGDAPGSLAPLSSLAVERGGRLHLLSGDALLTVTPR